MLQLLLYTKPHVLQRRVQPASMQECSCFLYMHVAVAQRQGMLHVQPQAIVQPFPSPQHPAAAVASAPATDHTKITTAATIHTTGCVGCGGRSQRKQTQQVQMQKEKEKKKKVYAFQRS